MSSKHFDDIKINFSEDTDTSVNIVAEPFERGYGVTIGNALRRTLMTSVPGAAIVSSKKLKAQIMNFQFLRVC